MKYLAVQDSKQYDGTLKKKDKEEHRIPLLPTRQEKGEGHMIDVPWNLFKIWDMYL